ncbi:hypothetical protein [Paractinoplanes brasiliensis]|uniref:Scramblase n=1 Tax=Paractinoplanes brasiliensis TaxID=52695 RepID=A0A4V3C688_9ACTN|nr:hypothetical protein [Actinoplanes brasiliensis]TDO32788.1 hypothetical protein C8E87_8260 [Actinoplanes brasiliensis]GID31668.1 hypothetical protein Abr02nite_66510 [Actinoplanes brasiliensis]
MQVDALRGGWPEEVLTGRYWFQTYGGTMADEVMSDVAGFLTLGLAEPETSTKLKITDASGRPMMSVRRRSAPGIQAIGTRRNEPWITLLQHKPQAQAQQPYLLRRMRAQLTDGRRTIRSRVRRAGREFTADWRRINPRPLQIWDILDNRMNRIIGRLAVPIDVPSARWAIFGATGRPAAMLHVEPGCLTVRVGARPVAQFVKIDRTHRVDVAGAGPAGLDPRLVLACALLEYAHLSDV